MSSKEVTLKPQDPMTSLKEQVMIAIKSGFLPQSCNTFEKAFVVGMKGKELNIPFLHAASHIHIIQGKPTVSSELMLSLIFRNCPGAQIHYVETSANACVIEASRPGGKPSRFSFTMDDAKAAGLDKKDNWKKFASAMLRARCIAIVARALFPDAIMGCSYTPEELGAEVDEDENVISIPPGEVVPERDPGEGNGIVGEGKYKSNPPNGKQTPKSGRPAPTEDEKQRANIQGALAQLMRQHGLNGAQVKQYALDWYNVSSSTELSTADLNEFLHRLAKEFASPDDETFAELETTKVE